MSPLDANHYGYVHGGAIMRYVDEAAFISAARHAGRNTVTASLDQMGFHHPVHLGDLLILKSAVNYVGTTSMEVGVRIESENPVTREQHYIGSAYV
ncbi:MAG: acyl-CoA thioesterase, partial [Deltaproteobacteria bacterium]|nr:acyl-CoA thioesterase [Deltaproteobacteria bacterium]